MDEETWKKGGGLVEKIPDFKRMSIFELRETENLRTLCALLKGNAIPTKTLDLSSDEERNREERHENENEIYEINR